MKRTLLAVLIVAASSAPLAAQRPGDGDAAGDPAAERIVKEALLLWNEANRSGDYRRFYRSLHPAFQVTTTPSRLAVTYGPFRERRLDFSTIAGLRPVLRSHNGGATAFDGVFDTRPQQLHFRLVFARSRGALKLYALEVDLAPPA